MIKQRENGLVIGVKVKTIYGDEREVLELLGATTSYVERTNLTSRHMNGRLVRKTLGYSKELRMLRASSIWEDAVYNLGRALKTLRIEADSVWLWIGARQRCAGTTHLQIEECSAYATPATNTINTFGISPKLDFHFTEFSKVRYPQATPKQHQR